MEDVPFSWTWQNYLPALANAVRYQGDSSHRSPGRVVWQNLLIQTRFTINGLAPCGSRLKLPQLPLRIVFPALRLFAFVFTSSPVSSYSLSQRSLALSYLPRLRAYSVQVW